MRMRRKKTKTPITLHLSFGICSKLADICIPGRAREVQDPTAGGNQTRSSRNHGARRHQSRHQSRHQTAPVTAPASKYVYRRLDLLGSGKTLGSADIQQKPQHQYGRSDFDQTRVT